MPTKSHHRSRSSIDRVIDLLADLEENQIALLLDDLNHTTSSNVPVSEAIALFEHHSGKPRKRFARSPSPVRTLQAELERRHSKRISARISSAPEPWARSKAVPSPPPVPQQQQQEQQQQQQPPPPAAAVSPLPVAEPSDCPEHPDRPSLTPPSPVPVERPKPAPTTSQSSDFRPRSYKRISRPTFLSPTATAELHLLLLAFFNSEAPASATTTTTTTSPASTATATPSFTTPQFFGMSHSPFSDLDLLEPDTPGLDLLEPSPMRTPSFSPGRSLRTAPSMSSIFEVLRSQ